jgi:hypothetical protein
MKSDERTVDFHPQDWIIIVEALAQWAGPFTSQSNRREERAYEIIEAIAREQRLPPSELLRQAETRSKGGEFMGSNQTDGFGGVR